MIAFLIVIAAFFGFLYMLGEGLRTLSESFSWQDVWIIVKVLLFFIIPSILVYYAARGIEALRAMGILQ